MRPPFLKVFSKIGKLLKLKGEEGFESSPRYQIKKGLTGFG